jgi:hypothetical protein
VVIKTSSTVVPGVTSGAGVAKTRLEVAFTVAVPVVYPVLVAVIVAVDDLPGPTPVTVTKPVPLIVTDPDAVAVPAQVYEAE